jgi:hypothetical protein
MLVAKGALHVAPGFAPDITAVLTSLSLCTDPHMEVELKFLAMEQGYFCACFDCPKPRSDDSLEEIRSRSRMRSLKSRTVTRKSAEMRRKLGKRQEEAGDELAEQ